MIVVVLLFLFLMALGIPIAFVLGLGSTSYILLTAKTQLAMLVAQRMVAGVNNFVLLSIPFFLLAGDLMKSSGITKGIVRLCDLVVGWLYGALAHIAIAASIFFAGITGAAVADAASIGSILIPAMKEQGYDVDFAGAVVAAASVIGPIIPPSIIAVVYGVTTGVSIGGLFVAGFVPGILMGLGLMVYCYFMARRHHYPRRTKPVTLRDILEALRESIWAILMPVILMAGILSGVFTVTEAAAVTVVYGLVVGIVRRTLTWSDIWQALQKAAVASSVVLLIIAGANSLGWVLTYERVPQIVAQGLVSLVHSKAGLLLLVNIILLITGMLMETSAAILLLAPLLAPIAVSMGIDPLHFGIIFVVNLAIGVVTPPLGVSLYVTVGLTRRPLEVISKAILPMVAIEVAVLLFITYAPSVTLFLPRVLGY